MSNFKFLKNSGDCGMFVIKAMEFLTHGYDLSEIRQDDMAMYRQKITIDLYRHGAVKIATKVGSDFEMDDD